jgi:hypothetical protein
MISQIWNMVKDCLYYLSMTWLFAVFAVIVIVIVNMLAHYNRGRNEKK